MTNLHQAAQKAVEARPLLDLNNPRDGYVSDAEWAARKNTAQDTYETRLRAVLDVVQRWLPSDGIDSGSAMIEITKLVDPMPASALQQQPEPVAPFTLATPVDSQLHTAPPALQQQEVPREPVALADAAWVRRLRETAKHLRENSLSLAKYPGMSDEARARELAALYIGEIAELFEAKRTAASPSTPQQQEVGNEPKSENKQ